MPERRRYRAVPTAETYRGEPDALGRRDHFWRVASAHDTVADGSEGYRNKKEMVGGMRSAFIGLLRWFARRDRVWLEVTIGEVLRDTVGEA